MHKYHQDMILNKFKKYYEHHEDQKGKKMREFYEAKLRKVEREANSCLPEDLMEICVERERDLTQKVKRKKKKTLRM